MNIDNFREYCLRKPGTTEEFPFDNETLVFKVMGKMYALSGLKSWEEGEPRINLKCDPERALELRADYPESVLPGFHMNKKHCIIVPIYIKHDAGISCFFCFRESEIH